MRSLLLIVGLLWSCLSFALPDQWWVGGYPERFDTSQLKKQSTISIKGLEFVNEKGKTFTFKGVNIADPDKLAQQGKWGLPLFEEVKKWGANTIRVPVHPGAWTLRGADQYIEWIDQAVLWANQLDMYLILDWHSIGNLQSGLYQHPMYKTDWEHTQDFWQRMAFRYKNVPTLAVYELFNEPTNNYIGNGVDSLGKMDWGKWVGMMESLIDLIRAYDEDVIPLVAGFNWAYDLSAVRYMPVNRENIAYAIHPYPQKAKPKEQTRENFFMLWQYQWGFVAEQAPMIATEIGWSDENAPGAHVPTINNDGSYGPRIIDFLAERGISWTAWVFDPEWSPQMIKNWDFEPTEQGEFFKKVMQGKYKSKGQ